MIRNWKNTGNKETKQREYILKKEMVYWSAYSDWLQYDNFRNKHMNRILKSLKSKTIWFGVLQVIGGVSLALATDLQTGGGLTILGILTIILRAITTKPLSAK